MFVCPYYIYWPHGVTWSVRSLSCGHCPFCLDWSFFFFWVLTLHSFIEYFCTIYSENKTIIYDISHSSIAWSIACHSFYSYSMPFSRLTQIIKRKHKGKYQIFLNLPKVWTMGKRGKQQQINDGGNVTLVWEGPEWVHQSGDIGTEQSKNTPKTGISII